MSSFGDLAIHGLVMVIEKTSNVEPWSTFRILHLYPKMTEQISILGLGYVPGTQVPLGTLSFRESDIVLGLVRLGERVAKAPTTMAGRIDGIDFSQPVFRLTDTIVLGQAGVPKFEKLPVGFR